jgi:hypothetical protein
MLAINQNYSDLLLCEHNYTSCTQTLDECIEKKVIDSTVEEDKKLRFLPLIIAFALGFIVPRSGR